MAANQRAFGALAAAAVAAASILAVSADASAYCRTSSCGDLGTGAVCVPPLPSDCGIPISWPSACVSVSLHEGASKLVPLEKAEEIFQAAFNAWMTAACSGGGTPRIDVRFTEPVACDQHEYSQKDGVGNANIIAFRDDAWTHEGADSTLALTTVTYNVTNGEIYDADMEINSATNPITTGDIDVKFDLLSIATHEAGHFLGLSHSMNDKATMSPKYMGGTTDLRDLDDDDRAGICAVYPPGDPIPAACDSTPRHGFSALCASDAGDPDTGCCSVAPGRAGGSGREAVIAAIAAAAALSARRRRAGRIAGARA